MSDDEVYRPLVMFHGTSSQVLSDILETGLSGELDDRQKTSVALDTLGHLGALPGVYLAADMEVAAAHASGACRIRGGDPVIVSVAVDPLTTVPDEDHLLEFVGNYGEDLGRFFDLEGFLDRWREDASFGAEVSEKVAADMRQHFSPLEESGLQEAVREILQFAFHDMTAAEFEDATSSRGHVLSPNILEPGMAAPGGIERYRALMDKLCLAMKGTGPYADLEGHSVRIPGSIGYDGPNRIVAIGNEEDLGAHFIGDIPPDAAAELEGWGWQREAAPAV